MKTFHVFYCCYLDLNVLVFSLYSPGVLLFDLISVELQKIIVHAGKFNTLHFGFCIASDTIVYETHNI